MAYNEKNVVASSTEDGTVSLTRSVSHETVHETQLHGNGREPLDRGVANTSKGPVYKETFSKKLMLACVVTFVTVLIALSVWIFKNCLVEPTFIYDPADSEDTLTVTDDFSGIRALLEPQMIIRFKNYILLCVHLDGYYESEGMVFTGNKAVYKKCRQEYCDRLKSFVKNAVIGELKNSSEIKNPKQLESDLQVYVSIIGGVNYKNSKGNDVHGLCIIEDNNIMINYDMNDKEVTNRLYEADYTLGDDPALIEYDPEVRKIVTCVSDEVEVICHGKT